MDEIITTGTPALQIDSSNSLYLTEAAKWGKFLSIVGFIFCALMVLYGLLGGSLMAKLMNKNAEQFGGNSVPSAYLAFGSSVFTVIMIIFALVYFFPTLYLYNFSSRMQSAIRNNDQTYLNASFKNLKSCFKFWGIMLIVILSFYAIVAIFATIAGFSLTR